MIDWFWIILIKFLVIMEYIVVVWLYWFIKKWYVYIVYFLMKVYVWIGNIKYFDFDFIKKKKMYFKF